MVAGTGRSSRPCQLASLATSLAVTRIRAKILVTTRDQSHTSFRFFYINCGYVGTSTDSFTRAPDRFLRALKVSPEPLDGYTRVLMARYELLDRYIRVMMGVHEPVDRRAAACGRGRPSEDRHKASYPKVWRRHTGRLSSLSSATLPHTMVFPLTALFLSPNAISLSHSAISRSPSQC